MSVNKKPMSVEYVCSYCGKKVTKHAAFGRPEPGTCPRKTGNKPHSWRINRKF